MYRIYPKELEFWKWAVEVLDFDILMATTRAVAAKKILEFWPWVSTYAFILWCADTIHSYEADPEYYKLYTEEFKDYPWVDIRFGEDYPETDELYDIAFVDGPKGSEHLSRINSLNYAVKHSKITILHDSKRPGENESLKALQSEGYVITNIDTTVWMTFIIKL